MIEMTEPQPPAKSKELLALEKFLGASLPEDYRRFVLQHNGGWSHDYGMDYREKGFAKPQRLSIYCWLPIGRLQKQTRIPGVEEVLRHMSGELPSKALPFARDDCGDPLLLMLNPTGYGAVYFFSFQAVSGNMIKLAGNFSEFINGLKLDRRRA